MTRFSKYLVSTLVALVFSSGAISGQPEFPLTLDSTLISKSLFLDVTRTGNYIIAVGERGHIVLSKDGRNWKQAVVPVDSTLTGVYFHDERLGWAVGHDAVILKTGDGGHTWRKVYSDVQEEAPLLDIWFRNSSEGIAIGAYGMYLLTHDGGETWDRNEFSVVDTQDEEQSGETDALVDLYDLHLNSITGSADGRLYIVAEAGRIYRSEDSGNTWQELTSPYIGSLFGILAPSPATLLVFGLRGHLYLSQNAGESWELAESHTREMLTDGTVLNNGTIVISGMGGTLLISHDNGLTFNLKQLSRRSNFSAVEYTGSGTLVMTGDTGISLVDINQSGPNDE